MNDTNEYFLFLMFIRKILTLVNSAINDIITEGPEFYQPSNPINES